MESKPAGHITASSSGGEGSEDSQAISSDGSEEISYSEGVRSPSRSPQLCSIPGPSRETEVETSGVVDEFQHANRDKGLISFPPSSVFFRPRGVDQPSVATDTGSYETPNSNSGDYDRRFRGRVGRSLSPPQDIGGLAPGVPSELDQLARAPSNIPHARILPVGTKGFPGIINDSQHHSSGVLQEPGHAIVHDFIGIVEEVIRVCLEEAITSMA